MEEHQDLKKLGRGRISRCRELYPPLENCLSEMYNLIVEPSSDYLMVLVVPPEEPDEILHALHAVLSRVVRHLQIKLLSRHRKLLSRHRNHS